MIRYLGMAALLLAVGCAAAQPPGPMAASTDLPAPVEEILSELSFQFTVADGPADEVYQSSGPYEVVSITDTRIELAGYDWNHLTPTKTVLQFAGDQVWATVYIGDRDFLARVR